MLIFLRLSAISFFAIWYLGIASAAAEMVVTLRGLDKITARITTFEVDETRSERFGTLRITLRRCRKNPPEETPEVVAFLEIGERRPGEEREAQLFSGWMFASSPALNGLEHPVYDVWVIDCRTTEGDGDQPPSVRSR